MTRSNGKERLRFSLAVAFGGITISSIAIAALRNGPEADNRAKEGVLGLRLLAIAVLSIGFHVCTRVLTH